MNTNEHDEHRPPAVLAAETGSQAWRRVVHSQLSARPDHQDFCALACELVDTLRSMESLTWLLRRQVDGYAAGRELYDDTGDVEPRERLAEATELLRSAQTGLVCAERSVNEFWSAIGHIGVEVPS